jgi:hypothetical protein
VGISTASACYDKVLPLLILNKSAIAGATAASQLPPHHGRPWVNANP